MSGRSGISWQTSLADLSLVLFMITAAAATQQKPHPAPPSAKAAAMPGPSVQSEPIAVYADAPGAPPLAQWLDQQAADPRQQLTVTARYGPAPGALRDALDRAERLAEQAGALGRAARVVVEPGQGATQVVLAYDAPGAKVARNLLYQGVNRPTPDAATHGTTP